MIEEMRSGGHAIIVHHSAVAGRSETTVREFHVSEVRPYAQYSCSVSVRFLKPRARKQKYAFNIVPDNIIYFTIEVNGHEVYDSRRDVPCDMAKWEETDGRFKERRAIRFIELH
jgi:hypothetical protein